MLCASERAGLGLRLLGGRDLLLSLALRLDGVDLVRRLRLGLSLLPAACLLGALFGATGLDLGLELLLLALELGRLFLDLGQLLGGLGVGPRLGGVGADVDLLLLKPALAGEGLVVGQVPGDLLCLAGDLAEDSLPGYLAFL